MSGLFGLWQCPEVPAGMRSGAQGEVLPEAIAWRYSRWCVGERNLYSLSPGSSSGSPLVQKPRGLPRNNSKVPKFSSSVDSEILKAQTQPS